MVTPARRTNPSLQNFPRGMLAAAVLLGLAGLIGLAGLATVAAALATACPRWYGRADLAPAGLAQLKWERAKAAATAGSAAGRATEPANNTPHSTATARRHPGHPPSMAQVLS